MNVLQKNVNGKVTFGVGHSKTRIFFVNANKNLELNLATHQSLSL